MLELRASCRVGYNVLPRPSWQKIIFALMMKMDKSTWLAKEIIIGLMIKIDKKPCNGPSLLAKEIIFALMMKMEKRTLQWSVMLPLVCTWNPWGPGVRPKTWGSGLSFNRGAGDVGADGDSGRGGDVGDDYYGGDDEDHDLSVHLSLHPNLNIIPGHPNLPGDPGTTKSDKQQKKFNGEP